MLKGRDGLCPFPLLEIAVTYQESELREKTSFGFLSEKRLSDGKAGWPFFCNVKNLSGAELRGLVFGVFFIGGDVLLVGDGGFIVFIEQEEIFSTEEANVCNE